MQVKTFPIILEQTIMLSPTVKHFIFKTEHEAPFKFAPGQFITLHFEHEGKYLRRSYSVANLIHGSNRIEFAANYVAGGPGSEKLFQLKPGDTLNINGPFGRLTLKEEQPSRYIFIATSTGVTPYRAMREELNRRMALNPNLQVVILLGARESCEILYATEFLEWAKTSKNITFRAHLSRHNGDTLAAHEYTGYVQTSFPDLALNPTQDVVYLCGNPAMIDTSFEILKNLGFTTQNVIREKYISS